MLLLLRCLKFYCEDHGSEAKGAKVAGSTDSTLLLTTHDPNVNVYIRRAEQSTVPIEEEHAENGSPTPSRGRLVTIKDVAREARVSVATVSRVFNGGGPVREATRLRIREIATALRYVPHAGARSLITSKTSTLGVLLPDLYGEFFSEVIRGIDLAARKAGYHLIVSRLEPHTSAPSASPTGNGSREASTDKSIVEGAMRAMRGRVDGVIVMSPDIDAQALVANLPDSVPVVLLNCALRGAAFDSVNIDNTRGAHAIVRHLISHGHRRIAIIAGAPRNLDGNERHLGYQAALSEAAIDRNVRWEAAGNFSEDSGFEAARALLKLRSRPTAIFAANDSMAIGALSALREAGVSVPEEIAVAGFDDIPIARHINPPLTSVHVPIAELGERATAKLLAALRDKARHVRRHDVLGTTLVIRSSCGPAGHT